MWSAHGLPASARCRLPIQLAMMVDTMWMLHHPSSCRSACQMASEKACSQPFERQASDPTQPPRLTVTVRQAAGVTRHRIMINALGMQKSWSSLDSHAHL